MKAMRLNTLQKSIGVAFLITFGLVTERAFAQIPTDSLFFYTPFSGNFNDVVGTMSGTNSGGLLVQDRFINDSASLYLDGVNDLVDYGTGLKMNNIDYFSASVWVQPEDYYYTRTGGPRSGRYTILGDAGGGYGFRFFQYQDELHFTVASIVGTDSCFFKLSSSDQNDWIHLVGVSDSGYLSIYANGKHIRTVAAQNSTRKLGYLNLEYGRGTLNNKVYWEGRIDEVRMYNRTLSATEVKALYEAELSKTCKTTVRDTIWAYDTTSLTIYDTVTTNIRVNDTTQFFDTLNITVYDTIRSIVQLTDTIPLYDSTLIVEWDTVDVIVKEKVTVPVYDTIYIYRYDTQEVKLSITDTTIVKDTLNIFYNTSIENAALEKVLLYPNPSRGIVNIERLSSTKNTQVVITNSLGQEVWRSTRDSSQNSGESIFFKRSGVYYLNVFLIDGTIVDTKPFVVSK